MEILLGFDKDHEKLTIAVFKNHEKLIKNVSEIGMNPVRGFFFVDINTETAFQSYNGLPLFPINLRQFISESC